MQTKKKINKSTKSKTAKKTAAPLRLVKPPISLVKLRDDVNELQDVLVNELTENAKQVGALTQVAEALRAELSDLHRPTPEIDDGVPEPMFGDLVQKIWRFRNHVNFSGDNEGLVVVDVLDDMFMICCRLDAAARALGIPWAKCAATEKIISDIRENQWLLSRYDENHPEMGVGAALERIVTILADLPLAASPLNTLDSDGSGHLVRHQPEGIHDTGIPF